VGFIFICLSEMPICVNEILSSELTFAAGQLLCVAAGWLLCVAHIIEMCAKNSVKHSVS
jgi:hypothetical protein